MPLPSDIEFFILPTRIANAPVNMADDLAMLELFPQKNAIRFRHYEWLHPCWTFGYSLNFEKIQNILRLEPSIPFYRRPTGGGLVRHQLDWTYSLVIPPNHPYFRHPPRQVYKAIHESLASALQTYQCAAELIDCPQENMQSSPQICSQRISKYCFDKPEIFDLILTNSGHKVAGLAMRRTRLGLLIQGSIHKIETGALPWSSLQSAFIQKLTILLKASSQPMAWPSYPIDPLQELRQKMASSEWISKR